MTKKVKFSIFSILFLLLMIDSKSEEKFKYQVPTSKEIEANRFSPKELIFPEKLKAGHSKYREPLPLKDNYRDNPNANKKLLEIYKHLKWDWRNTPNKNWNTPENIKMLMKFIKKYPDTSQAVTAKLLLSLVLGEPFYCDTLPSFYWSLDILHEVYEQFPDKWQGKVALSKLYERMFFPAAHCKPEWSYQFLDDYESINWELEKMYLQKNKERSLTEYEEFRSHYIRWERVWSAYCHMAASRWIKETGHQEELLKKSQAIFVHMWNLCKTGKYCIMTQSYMKEQVRAKHEIADHSGRCVPDKLE